MELVGSAQQPRTIFFGGGTPSLLNLRQWEQVLETMGRLDWLKPEEWTVECNPATVSLDKAKLLRSYGVNRISMGVQSLNENLLDRLGRVHSREMVFRSFDILRAAGFDNINVDLMFAIPGQTMEIWSDTLTEAIALGSEHLSCYEVIYEEDTPLFAQLKAGEFSVDDELASDMHELLVLRACQAGFQQYEIANFARHPESGISEIPSKACQHNINYWRGGAFHGLGPSATEYLNGRRAKNCSNTALYCEQLERGERPVEWSEELTQLARAGETAAFGLRMNAGWPFNLFKQTTCFDLREQWNDAMQDLVDQGLARMDDERFQLTSSGLRFADSAAEKFLVTESPAKMILHARPAAAPAAAGVR
jgi:oxygen-independent coproporphyrinogen III oxidase